MSAAAGRVMVFLRPAGGDGFGHVGWGFQEAPRAAWLVGSLENPSGRPVVPGDEAGFWCAHVANGEAAAAAMRNPPAAGAPSGTPPYGPSKALEVAAPDVAAAMASLERWKTRPYVVLGGNCMNCAYDILAAYGAALPDPAWNPREWAPNNWFRAIGEPPG